MKEYVRHNPNYNAEESQIIHVFAHKDMINHYLSLITTDIINKASVHDDSKLHGDEKKYFIKSLKDTYPSSNYLDEEYIESMKQENLSLALKFHYSLNDHHPEHHENGIEDMDLVQILEMLVDWKVGGLGIYNGDIFESIQKNKDRFGIDDQLVKILINTAKKYLKGDYK